MVCKKCNNKSILESTKDIQNKKCIVCKDKFKSRWIVLCSKCQYLYLKKYCLTCGKEIVKDIN
jgi:hypothetical protein